MSQQKNVSWRRNHDAQCLLGLLCVQARCMAPVEASTYVAPGSCAQVLTLSLLPTAHGRTYTVSTPYSPAALRPRIDQNTMHLIEIWIYEWHHLI